MSARKPPKKKTTAKASGRRRSGARAGTSERVQLGGLRTLGDVEPSTTGTKAASKVTPSRKKARTVLEAEFRRALEMKEKLAAESAIGGREKGRQASRQQEKMRSIVNSLEGMNRFALQMGLITPAESRDLYAKAMKDGLYEGWIR